MSSLSSSSSKEVADAETQTFLLDLEQKTDINCNSLMCLQCGSSINCNFNLERLVNQANRNTVDNGIILKIESPKVTTPLSPTQTSKDSTADTYTIPPILSPPAQQQMDDTFQKLQEELVACKLREAESSLGFKELQQKVNQLGKQWQQFLKDSEQAKNASDIKTRTLIDLRESVMALKVRETCMVSDFNDLKQKLIELETENNIYKRQAKRLQEELDKKVEELSQASLREDELINDNKDFERKISDCDTKYQEDLIMFKIRNAEWCQAMAGMRRKVAELEIENQELVTALKLNNPKHSELFEKNPNTLPYSSSSANDKANGEEKSEPIHFLDRPYATEFQPNVLELLSKCDMSDIMTESFFADAMFLQPSQLLSNDFLLPKTIPAGHVVGENEDDGMKRKSKPLRSGSLNMNADNISGDNNNSDNNFLPSLKQVGQQQIVECDSLERLNLIE